VGDLIFDLQDHIVLVILSLTCKIT